MGDRTAASLTIHACLPHRVRAVLNILDQHSFVDEDEVRGRNSVNLGVPYTCGEGFPVGDAASVTRALMDAAPEVSFTVYEEPAYDGLGATYAYVPHLGVFDAACGNDGIALLPQPYVLNIQDQEPAERQMRLGVPWLTAIAAMPQGTVTEPDSFVAHCIPHHNEFVIVGCRQGGGDLRFSFQLSGGPPTADLAASDNALTGFGFRRLSDWAPFDETFQLWRTNVYAIYPS